MCYAPEMESIQETRVKLVQRRKEVAIRTRGEADSQSSSAVATKQKITRSKKHPALALTEDRLQASDLSETSCIWKGIPTDIDPRIKLKPAPELLKVGLEFDVHPHFTNQLFAKFDVDHHFTNHLFATYDENHHFTNHLFALTSIM